METIKIQLKKRTDDSHTIYLGAGLIQKLPDLLQKNRIGDQYAIITDDVTRRLYGNALIAKLEKAGIQAQIFSFNKGESSKTLTTIEQLAKQMVKAGFDRKDAVIALGGGVVGDMAGFLAAIYKRGIPYIQIPTTLLAMVDSAIGGKTGVDLQSGKNLLGMIHQPKMIVVDTDFLTTLPQKQIRNGLGEIIKYGVICDAKFFSYLEKNLQAILSLDQQKINHVIKRSIEIKAHVVEQDESEQALRMVLNYGHTYGHALEQASNYTLLHGFAISIGMVIANKMAVEAGLLKETDAQRIKNLLKAAGLPVTTVKKPELKDLRSDKKCYGGFIHFVLPTKIGAVTIHQVKCP